MDRIMNSQREMTGQHQSLLGLSASRSTVVAQLLMSSLYWRVSALRHKQMLGDRKGQTGEIPSFLHVFGASCWAKCRTGHGWALKHEQAQPWSRWTNGLIWHGSWEQRVRKATQSQSEQPRRGAAATALPWKGWGAETFVNIIFPTSCVLFLQRESFDKTGY